MPLVAAQTCLDDAIPEAEWKNLEPWARLTAFSEREKLLTIGVPGLTTNGARTLRIGLLASLRTEHSNIYISLRSYERGSWHRYERSILIFI